MESVSVTDKIVAAVELEKVAEDYDEFGDTSTAERIRRVAESLEE